MKNKEKTHIHFIQNEATPHNNQLISDFLNSGNYDLTLWYARDYSNEYSWKEDLTNKYLPAKIYGDKLPNFFMAFKLAFDQKSKIFQTGWETPTAKLIIILCFFSRKNLNLWCDLPNPHLSDSFLKALLRNLLYYLLKKPNIKLFCAGKEALDYFTNKLVNKKDSLINLPINIYHENDINFNTYAHEIKKKYNALDKSLFITSGSRLVKEKGFDLLIKSISMLDADIQKNIKLIIFGMGSEKDNLEKEINENSLNETITMVEWLDINDMRALVASSDLFIHPARFDAYGAGTLNAMSLGTPVIATKTSGSGPALIDHGSSGWLYDADDTEKLSELITFCFNNLNELDLISKNAKIAFDQSEHKNIVNKIIKNII